MKNKLATFFVKEKAKGRLSKNANEERLAYRHDTRRHAYGKDRKEQPACRNRRS
jgi:hypothetical protein